MPFDASKSVPAVEDSETDNKWGGAKPVEATGEESDPQRHVTTDYMFRSGPSAFAVLSKQGNIDSDTSGDTGLYVGDMRVVSQFSMTVNGNQPHVLKASGNGDYSNFSFRLKNPTPNVKASIDYTMEAEGLVARIKFKNIGNKPQALSVAFNFAADHHDTFYVRFPANPLIRGMLHDPVPDMKGQSIQYDTIDNRTMRSFVRFSEAPQHEIDGVMRFTKTLQPKEEFNLVAYAGLQDKTPTAETWPETKNALSIERRNVFANSARIQTGNTGLTQWLKQCRKDVALLTAEMPTGLYTFAGLPWFNLPFGRDGLITALEKLAINPDLMKGTLRHHVKYEAKTVDPVTQAQPGKRMHEMRLGETSGKGINPFKQYYGNVDTTLLFVVAAHEWWKRTADDEAMNEFWPSIDSSLHWISDYGDLRGDGLVWYQPDPKGLINQGWKDSWDAIVHADGKIATKDPIALCEVQGYAYAAWRAGQVMAERLGLHDRSEFCRKAAENVYKRFNELFWMEDKGIYGLALDGDKLCKVMASNMGHLGWTGIVPPERARRVTEALMGKEMFSGWGIRTLGSGEKRYKADLYHRGPCWPHETAFANWSNENAGDFEAVRTLATAMLDTAKVWNYRLPELFCGYARKEGEKPVPYPSANSPHSWAAALGFSMVNSAAGLKVDAQKMEVSVNPSGLPRDWAPLTYRELEVGGGRISFRIDPDPAREFRVTLLSQTGAKIRLVDARTGEEILKPRPVPVMQMAAD